ncbi:hypothetical protein JOQ06_000055, partial [Pogonophryne albipinna]
MGVYGDFYPSALKPLTSSRADTVFLQWDILVVKLEAVVPNTIQSSGVNTLDRGVARCLSHTVPSYKPLLNNFFLLARGNNKQAFQRERKKLTKENSTGNQ